MSDPRFAALKTDPRYRLPSRKESRTAVDPRFKRLFTDEDFRKKAKVDRYGRKIQAESGKRDLERLYRLDKEGKRDVVGSSDDDDPEDLVETKDRAREGFSESESEEETSSDEDKSEDEAELAEETAGQEQTEDVPMGEVSRRIAVVNLDWDNLRAMDIMAVSSSFVPTEGKIESVTIYPSEFGRERLQREELEGPPREIFASSTREVEDEEPEEDSDEDDDKEIERKLQEEQVDEGDEFDTAKLRQYQLERLRYYYAVITCSSKSTAKTLYDSMDGREYLTTSNFFDLRFVPDSTSFEDDAPSDECTSLPPGYKPNEFRTEALTHSKVRLTWDQDDVQRQEVQKRAFSRAEIDENDLQAYIGSESSDAESVASRRSAAEDRKQKKSEAKRASMRAALGLGEEETKPAKKTNGRDEAVGDMQITFTSGLSGKEGKSVFENEPMDAESTRDRYVRKEKERKQKRKEKMKAARTDVNADAQVAADDEHGVASDAEAGDLGFEDPFFTDPTAAAAAEKRAKKADRQAKRDKTAAGDAEAASRRAELELIMADDNGEGVRHFDMRDVEKAEKNARRKGKDKKGKKKKPIVDAEVQDGFQVDSQDPRFKALFESHEYAIDPTNPRFKGTSGMKSLLEEGRKKRKVEDADEAERPKRSKKDQGRDGELGGLVKRLQSKR